MNPNTPLGVLTDTDFLLVGMEGGKSALQSLPVSYEMSELNTLFRYAVQIGLTSVWVMPGTRLSREVSCSFLEQADGVWEVVTSANQLDPARPLCASVWRKVGTGRQGPILSLTFPEHGRWAWLLPDATTLLATVTYLGQTLGMPVSCSPEQLALDLLKGLTSGTDTSWTRPPTVDLHNLPTSDGQIVPLLESAQPVVWMRPLTIAEWRMRYLHKYEHSSQDLEVCAEVQLGAGNPLYSANGRAYDGNVPGIWRVKAETAGSVFDGKRLPSCIHGEWMCTPEVKRCTDISYQVQVTEGYYWPEAHRTLERWSTTLWRALQRLKPTNMTPPRQVQARANAMHTIHAITQLAIDKLINKEAPAGLYRPDWWTQIIGQGRARTFASLVPLVRRGFMPMLVDRNAFWLVSIDPNPVTAVSGLLTPEKQGGYKVAYETPLTLSREIKEAIRTTSNADQLATMLDAAARREDR